MEASSFAGRAFAAWMEAQGHTLTGTEYDWDDMAEAFAAGWRAAREDA